MMVEQFGLAIRPGWFLSASGFTSGITRGTRASMRHALVLSMTTPPRDAHAQACSFERLPPALEKMTSAPRSPSSGKLRSRWPSPLNLTALPADLGDA